MMILQVLLISLLAANIYCLIINVVKFTKEELRINNSKPIKELVKTIFEISKDGVLFYTSKQYSVIKNIFKTIVGTILLYGYFLDQVEFMKKYNKPFKYKVD